MNELEFTKKRIADMRARIRIIKNSNMPESNKSFLIDNWRQLVEANKQIVKLLEK